MDAIIVKLLTSILKNKVPRKILLSKLEKDVKTKLLNQDESPYPENVSLFKFHAIKAMYTIFFQNYDREHISPLVTDRVIETLVSSVMLGDHKQKDSKASFYEKYRQSPPNLLTISPTKKCNLKCEGCYASSSSTESKILDWSILNRTIEDAYENMGMRFFVISGGEPLMYKSNNNSILDLVSRWKDCYFLMYTNGTLISESIAARIATLGNLTPAISIEGYEENTDRRRGLGVYNRIVQAKNYLLKYGVPFGLSVTATKDNIQLLLNEDFYDYYFNDWGASHMWIFQYIPIGREYSTDLMITPEQRIQLFKKQQEILIEKKYFVADFWNSAMMSNGCISCGRPGGYFYINWDGNIMPCVFIPYYVDNVFRIYESGKTLSDALFSSFFKEGRKWQIDYIKNEGKLGNLLMPCFYRDHYEDFYRIARQTGVQPENSSASKAIISNEYYQDMICFDKQLENLSSKLWQRNFLDKDELKNLQ